ncbi:hypothetical protein [Riemerella columbina]|uniref:hypothetical protein n=1 Tax=Riemerella columbina TaxID=103810 RepID=UPI00037D99E7|nr:hypothetical protein [Riemerella columbina]
MNTSIISAEINNSDIQLLEELLKKFKAKDIKIEDKNIEVHQSVLTELNKRCEDVDNMVDDTAVQEKAMKIYIK